jgi:hypothetical protein
MVDYLSDQKPLYIPNHYANYENTILQEHTAMVSGLRDTSAVEALIEAQGTLFIGLCKKDDTITYIDGNFDKYYKDELAKITDPRLTDEERSKNAYNRTWLRLIVESMSHAINKYKLDGSKAKIAYLDNIVPFSYVVIDVEDVPVEFTSDEKGL